MKSLAISAEVKNENGKSFSKNLRREGKVPCVVYGGESTLHIVVDEKEVNQLIYTPEVIVAEINLEGKTIRALVQDSQFHPVTDKTEHVDFLEVTDSKPVRVSLPVKFTGNSVGVRAGGKLKPVLRKLKVQGFTKDLPDFIEIDITNVNIGQNVRVRSISIPNITFLDSPDGVIASVAATRASMKEEAAAAADSKKK
jgi:large subunit ribosomal protein L25